MKLHSFDLKHSQKRKSEAIIVHQPSITSENIVIPIQQPKENAQRNENVTNYRPTRGKENENEPIMGT